MPLTFVTETLSRVHSSDLESFVREEYPSARNFSFQADQECADDSCHRFTVRPYALGEWDQKTLAKFTAGGFVANATSIILNDLCHRGRIPSGTYLIEVY